MSILSEAHATIFKQLCLDDDSNAWKRLREDHVQPDCLVEGNISLRRYKPWSGRFPLYLWACSRNALGVMDLLSDGAKVNQTDEDGRTALMWASRHGHASVVEQLVAAKADLDVKDKVFGKQSREEEFV
eukprot:m.206567 g.206567  ORF g.206567 m.206567 type:complete len:129 (+) comp26064_c1_seq13:74-460(+)